MQSAATIFHDIWWLQIGVVNIGVLKCIYFLNLNIQYEF
jgi:hypothetical protein